MTSATDELRRLLDERGVEYEAYRDVKNRCITKWCTYHGAFVFFAVEKEGKLFVETASDTEHSAICTPEQAVVVTLGNDKKLITIALQLVRDHYCYTERFDESCIELERWCYDHGETDLMEYAMALRCPTCAFVPMDDVEDGQSVKLTAEQVRELIAFSRRLEAAAHDKLGTTLFGVDYVTEDFMLRVRDTLIAERDELQRKLDIANAKLAGKSECEICDKATLLVEIEKLRDERNEWKTKCESREFAYKQADAERKRYSEQIDELWAERDEWKAKLAELNARAERTCTVTHDFKCSNCGKQIGVVRNCEMYETCDGRQAWKSLDHEVCDIPNFCPNCGRLVNVDS